jgi:hypothetical protein
MALDEDLNLFLDDFGVSCTAGAVSALGILDMPTQVVAGDMVLSTDYTLTARAADFGGLVYGAAITVGGVNYSVREVRKLDDGAFVEIALQRLAPESSAPGQDPRVFGLSDLTDVDVAGAAAGDQLTYNGTEWVDAGAPKSITIANPIVGDNFTLFRTAVATTISAVTAVVRGSSPSVTFVIKSDPNRSSAGTPVTVSEAITNTTTGEEVAIINQPIAAGRYVWLEITAVSGSVTELNVSVEL